MVYFLCIYVRDVRRRGKFTFCYDDGGSLGMGSAIELTVDDEDKPALLFHPIAKIAHHRNRYIEDVHRADVLVRLDDVLPPINYKLTVVIGFELFCSAFTFLRDVSIHYREPGVYKAQPGVAQNLLNAILRVQDGFDGNVGEAE